MSSVLRPSQTSISVLSGAILRRFTLLTCISALGFAVTVRAADFIDPDTAIYDRIDKVGNPSLSDEERRKQSAALLDDDAWVQKVWRRISDLTIKSRYDKPLPPREEAAPEPKLTDPDKPKGAKANDPLALPDKDAPENVTDPEYATAVRSRSQLGSLVRALTQLQDERLPRFIGPLLGESGPDLSDEETMIPSPQTIAAGTLSALLSPDGKTTDYPEETDVEGWRRWWGENKQKFGPVLTVSARLDERPSDPEVEIVGLGAPGAKSAIKPPPLDLNTPGDEPDLEIIGRGAPKRNSTMTLGQGVVDDVEIIGRGATKPAAQPAPRRAPLAPAPPAPVVQKPAEKPIIRAIPIERRSAPAPSR